MNKWWGLWGLVLLSLAAVPARPSWGQPALQAVDAADRFGFAFINGITADGRPYAVSDLRYQQALDAGARWTRWPFYWYTVERQPGVFDYSAVDQVVNADLARGLKINAILMGTPTWAATSTPTGAQQVPGGRYGAFALGGAETSPPKNLNLPVFADGTDIPGPGKAINPENYWARFVYNTVKRYAPRIQTWEVWNEPDLGPPATFRFWSGSRADYARLLKVAYLAAKAADPGARVLFGGLAFWTDQTFFPDVLRVIRADPQAPASNYFFDALPVHPYISPYALTYLVDTVRNYLAGFQIPPKPIWVNETNIPVCGDDKVSPYLPCPQKWRGSPSEQASFALAVGALGAAYDLERLLIFQLYDDYVGYQEWYGVVRNDASPRPAYAAYRTATRYFSNYVTVRRREEGPADRVTLGGVRLGDSLYRVSVVWNRSAGPVTYWLAAAPAAQAVSVLDKYGQPAPGLQSLAGGYRIGLPPVTNPDLGMGEPYIILERVPPDTTPPVAAVSPWAGPVPERFTVRWTGSDSGWGVMGFDVQVREKGSPSWGWWLVDTGATAAEFQGQWGRAYEFRVRARDWAGLTGEWSPPVAVQVGCPMATPTSAQAAPLNGGFRTFFPVIRNASPGC